jgi:hypothetical protein
MIFDENKMMFLYVGAKTFLASCNDDLLQHRKREIEFSLIEFPRFEFSSLSLHFPKFITVIEKFNIEIFRISQSILKKENSCETIFPINNFQEFTRYINFQTSNAYKFPAGKLFP